MEQFRETALVIVVPEVDPFVKSLRAKYDPDAAGSIPAHITINYPFLPDVKIDNSLFQRLSLIFSAFQSFDFSLNEIGKFPGVIYLKPFPEDPFHHLVNTVVQEFPESPPYGGLHKDLIPHLTIAHSEFIAEYSRVENEIERKLKELLPIHSIASRVSYLEYQDNAWVERKTFPFYSP
jgi:hypothetical protein